MKRKGIVHCLILTNFWAALCREIERIMFGKKADSVASEKRCNNAMLCRCLPRWWVNGYIMGMTVVTVDPSCLVRCGTRRGRIEFENLLSSITFAPFFGFRSISRMSSTNNIGTVYRYQYTVLDDYLATKKENRRHSPSVLCSFRCLRAVHTSSQSGKSSESII